MLRCPIRRDREPAFVLEKKNQKKKQNDVIITYAWRNIGRGKKENADIGCMGDDVSVFPSDTFPPLLLSLYIFASSVFLT